MAEAMTDKPTKCVINPYLRCENKSAVTLWLCSQCGTVTGFTFGTNSLPDSGLWTECCACNSYRMFYRLHEGRIIRKTYGDAADQKRILDAVNDTRTATQIGWLNEQMETADNETANMLASIRNELFRFAEIQKRYLHLQTKLGDTRKLLERE